MNSIILSDIKEICENDIFRCEGCTFLVTGANGFIPSYMIYTLLYLNDNVFFKPCKIIALVRNKFKGEERFKEFLERQDFKLLVQDVNDSINISENIDYIIHAASQANPKYYGIDPVGTLKPNIIGTYNLLELAKLKNVKAFLFFSSGEVYGDTPHTPTNEIQYGYIDHLNSRNCYAESKRMGENMCISYLKQFGIPIKIVRPFHTYGPGVSLDDGRVFADFTKNIINNEDIVLKSDGKSIRTFCYISDAVLGFFYVLFKGKIGEAYNVSNDKCSISIKELALLLLEVFNNKNLKLKFNYNNDVYYIKSNISINYPDISKLKMLGWDAKVNLIDGFKRMIESFTCNDIKISSTCWGRGGGYNKLSPNYIYCLINRNLFYYGGLLNV